MFLHQVSRNLIIMNVDLKPRTRYRVSAKLALVRRVWVISASTRKVKLSIIPLPDSVIRVLYCDTRDFRFRLRYTQVNFYCLSIYLHREMCLWNCFYYTTEWVKNEEMHDFYWLLTWMYNCRWNKYFII